MFSLRADVASGDSRNPSSGLMEYMQTSLALGLLAITLELSTLLRCVLVNSTRPVDDMAQMELKSKTRELITEHKILSYDSEASFFRETSFTLSPTVTHTEERPDQPRSRFWFRRINSVMLIMYFAALAMGIAGNVALMAQPTDNKKSYANQALR